MKKLLALLFIFNILACGNKKTEKAAPSDIKTEFGINIPDKKVQFPQDVDHLYFKSTLDKNSVMLSSQQVLALAHALYDGAKDFDDDHLWKKRSNAMGQLLQVAGQTSTVMNTDVAGLGNPYATQAYYFVKPSLLKQFTTTLDQAGIRVEDVVGQIEVKPIGVSSEKTPLSFLYLQNIIEQLEDFSKKLLVNVGQSAEIVNPIIETIKSEYVKPLQDFGPKLSWRRNQKLEVFLADLQMSIAKVPGLSDADKKSSMTLLLEAIDYAKQVDQVSDLQKGVDLIVDMWMNKSNRSRFPEELVKVFKSMSEKQLLALATQNKIFYDDPQYWESLKNKIKTQFDNEVDKNKVKDFSAFSANELLTFYVSNSPLLKKDEWIALTSEKMIRNILSSKGANEFALFLGSSDEEQDKVKTLIFAWLNLRFRYSSFPKSLFDAFKDYNDQELENLKAKSVSRLILSPLSAIVRYKIESYIQGYSDSGEKVGSDEEGIKNFRQMMQEKVYLSVEKVLKTKIQGLSSNLKPILKKEIISRLDKQKEVFPKSVFDIFEKTAKKYLKLWFFENTESLPLLEANTLVFTKNPLAIWSVKGDLTETSSHTLGQSLRWDQNLIESKFTDKKTKQLLSFHALSKMACLGGFYDYNSNPIEALTGPVIINQNQKAFFDIFQIQAYDPAINTYAVSDRVFLSGAYRTNITKTKESAYVSVSGQMELLRGYVMMMNWTKPWVNSSFEDILGPLKVKEFEKVEGVKDIFSKSDLFSQSLALSLGILKNIQVRMVGLVNNQNQFYYGATLPVGDKRAAVLTDFDGKKNASFVHARDVALSIVALNELYWSLSDIEKTVDPQIISALKEITNAREQVKQLLSGLALFATGRLQQSDGSFVSTFNLIGMKPSESAKKLEDQLMMQKALMTAGQLLESDLIKSRAIDNAFYLNQSFWSEKIGFYKDTETSAGQQYQIKNVLLAYEVLKTHIFYLEGFLKYYPSLQSSIDQMKKMRELWQARLLSKEVLMQDIPELLYPQTPFYK